MRRHITVRPVLELLKARTEIHDYIYRDCATVEEFEFLLKKWSQRMYSGYPILYLALHGDRSTLYIGRRDYDLEELEEVLRGRCKRRLIVFGSCGTVGIDRRHLKRFLRETQAAAICGYKANVDWMRATAFELLLLSALQGNELSLRGVGAIQRRTVPIAKSFSDLQFRMVTANEVA